MSGTEIHVEPTETGIPKANVEDQVTSVPSSDEEEGSEMNENWEIEALEKRAFDDDDEGIISEQE